MDIQQAELSDARRGTLYFLGKIEIIKQPSFDVGLIGNFATGTTIFSDLTHASISILASCTTGRQLLDGVSKVTEPIRQLIADFFEAVSHKLTALYGEALGAAEWLAEFTSWAVSTFAGSLGDIIPGWGYVQNASDMYDGVKKAVTGAIKWMDQVYSGWGVELLQGGPAIMAEAIARHNATRLAGGIKDIALVSVKTGLQAAGDGVAGVGSIIGAVTGILQRLANLIEYAVQRYLMNKIISKADYQWRNRGLMLTSHNKFNDWFKRACALCPITAALTISSGFTAHPYRFLAMISHDGEINSQEEFVAGVKHIDTLKKLAKEYINGYQDCYKIKFQSSDPVVKARLEEITA